MGTAEHELKYVISNHRAKVIVGWLLRRCQPDPQYATGRVSSIYFDTRQWSHLDEKLNSDYLKSKVRIRWYSDYASREVMPGPFLEAKFKIGSRRKKVRIPLEADSRKLAALALENPIFPSLLRPLAAEGLIGHTQLLPAFQVNYTRRRFVDPITGARLCVDWNIHAGRVNPLMIPHCNTKVLPNAVVEVKDHRETLPDWLHQITALGGRKDAFSKYSHCYHQLQKSFYL